MHFATSFFSFGRVVLNWIEYAAKMPTGIPTEVDCLEFSLTRGDCHVRCLMLEKFGEDDYVFYIERPTGLVHMEDAVREVDEDGNYMPLEEVDGEEVLALLGDYYCGYGADPFPDQDNKIEFSDFNDPAIDQWLISNGWQKLDEIIPAQTTRENIYG